MKEVRLMYSGCFLLVTLTVATPPEVMPDDGPTTATDSELTTAAPNVTECREGFGYPVSCPRPEDPANHTRCCRHYHEPGCCEQRANRVCASKKRGLFRISGWNIDPDPDYAAVFCPRPGQSDDYTSCAYTREEIGCFNRKTLKIIIATTVVILAGVAPTAFIAFVIYSKWQEKRNPEQKASLTDCDSDIEEGHESDITRNVPRNASNSKSAVTPSSDSNGQNSTSARVKMLKVLHDPDTRQTSTEHISEA